MVSAGLYGAYKKHWMHFRLRVPSFGRSQGIMRSAGVSKCLWLHKRLLKVCISEPLLACEMGAYVCTVDSRLAAHKCTWLLLLVRCVYRCH